MSIEFVGTSSLSKPWGVADPRPWAQPKGDGTFVGELWYERTDTERPPASLLLKLLFTSQPLSIQVHPDDAFARSIGLPNGKSEAWYIIDAAAGAMVAVGLNRSCSSLQLRQSIEDGSIAGLVVWQSVSAGDVVSVPAGTIHAIGAGLVIAEIQQRSDTTFRLFDYGRPRGLHIDQAVAVAHTGPAAIQVRPTQISGQRTLLVTNQHFVLERIVLPPNSYWVFEAARETWLLVLSGTVTVGEVDMSAGCAIYAESSRAAVRTGTAAVTCLVAYKGDVATHLLQHHVQHATNVISTSDRIVTLSPLAFDDVAEIRDY